MELLPNFAQIKCQGGNFFPSFFPSIKKNQGGKKARRKNSFDLKFSFPAKPEKENAFKTIVNF
jgi:hypothetical protein